MNRLPFIFVLVAFALSACSGGGKSVIPTQSFQSGAARTRAALERQPFAYSVNPKASYVGDLNFSNCATAPSTLLCATPSTIRRAYAFPNSLQGTGETIVIVDAFGSPTIQNDLKTFDSKFHLPNPTLTVLKINNPPAFVPTDPNRVNWAIETSLDVEWAHAAAPGANIVLVVAHDDGDDGIVQAEEAAIKRHLGSVLSLSFGAPEADIKNPAGNPFFQEAVQLFSLARASSMTVIASAGDKGAGAGLGVPTAQFPASDPDVLAVGGTSLLLSPTGAYLGENVWNDANACVAPCILGADGATGGAPSSIFPAPSYQSGVTTSTMRTTADVSYNASPNTGVVVYIGFASLVPGLGGNGLYAVGGTSQGTPQWAGIVAIVNQQQNHVPLGFFNDKLYTIGTNNSTLPLPALHDILSGNNAFPGSNSPGFSAATGYDYPTGWGSPNVSNFVSAVTGKGP
ncbi:MAG: S53 family peptidase [Candidatus Eremiobacteraeota bacterium]|nr:S53 family peptidase [Candidatus Eremiobacteraeota bacterium]